MYFDSHILFRNTISHNPTVECSVFFSLGGVQIAAVDDVQTLAGKAYDVEQCSCGVGYSGLSCEVCMLKANPCN